MPKSFLLPYLLFFSEKKMFFSIMANDKDPPGVARLCNAERIVNSTRRKILLKKSNFGDTERMGYTSF